MNLLKTLMPGGGGYEPEGGNGHGIDSLANGGGIEPPVLSHYSEQAAGGGTTQPPADGLYVGADIFLPLGVIFLLVIGWLS